MELLVILDEQNIVRGYSGARELLRISAIDEIVGRSIAAVIAPEELVWFKDLWAEEASADGPIAHEVRTIRQHGSSHILEAATFWLPSAASTGWRVIALRENSHLRNAELRLEAAEARFDGWVEQAPAVVYSSSINSPGTSLYVSPHIEALLGYSVDEWRSVPSLWLDLLHPDDRQNVLDRSAETRATGLPFSMEYRLIARDGRVIWVSDDAIIVRDVDLQPRVWQGLVFDITGRKKAEQWLEGQKRVLEQIAQGAPLTSILDLIALTLENQASGIHCAVLLADPTRSTLRLIAAPSLSEFFAQTIDGVAIGAEGRTSGVAAYLRQPVITSAIASDERWVNDREPALDAGIQACWAIPILSSTNLAMGTLTIFVETPRAPGDAEELLIEAAVQLARIAIERQEMVDQLVHQAFTDSLTTLPNRALFQDRLTQALIRSRRRTSVVAILFLDLDNFKAVNDRFGHHAGDHLLKLVAERLRGCVRAEDTVARFGGDEFVILLEDEADTDEVLQVARRVLRHFNLSFDLGDERVPVIPSIGITFDSTGFAEPNDLLREADRAMYQAKRRGTGGYVIATVSQPEMPEVEGG
jgi:diguanylate cyclase (GGDEF)-like protein/PAS domain S-box-containing protein